MARLLDQVGSFSAIERRSGFIAYYEASAFEEAGNNPISSYSFIVERTTAAYHHNANFDQPSSIQNSN